MLNSRRRPVGRLLFFCPAQGLTLVRGDGSLSSVRFRCSRREMEFANTMSTNYISKVRVMSGPRVIVAVLSLVTLFGPGRSAFAAEVAGRGDFTFYLDSAAFRASPEKVLQEIYIRIPNNEITFVRAGDGYASRLKISIEIKDLAGNPVIQDAGDYEFSEDGEARTLTSLYFQTLIKRFLLAPGVYQMSYAVQDIEAPKRTVFGMVKNQFNISVVRNLRLEVPEIPENTPSFSLPEFAWSIDISGDDKVYHPNPPRVYGLYKDTLLVYVELYLPENVAAAPTFEFKSYVLDTDGNTVSNRDVSLPNPEVGERSGGMLTFPVVIREDLATFPAGAYSLHFSFALDGQVLSRVRAGRFSVAWDLRTWEVPRRAYLAEARFLLGDEEFEAFQNLSLGEQEQILDELWRSEDPSPETGVNEAYEMFIDRLEYVNQAFSEGAREALFTDRGQIYMKWGAPDEFVQDAIPVNRETISEAFAQVEDKFHPVNYSTHGVKRYTNAIQPPVIDHRRMSQVGEGGNTAFPFELWIYHGTGDPVLKRHGEIDPDIGSRYLFVDREGYGVYKLETSSKISDK